MPARKIHLCPTCGYRVRVREGVSRGGKLYCVRCVKPIGLPKRRGRPTTARGRTAAQVGGRLSPVELQRLQEHATRTGKSPFELLRIAYFGA